MALESFMEKDRSIKEAGEKVKTTVRLPADLYWQLQDARTKKRISSDEAIYALAIETALAKWREEGGSTKPEVLPAKEPLASELIPTPFIVKSTQFTQEHDKLERILRDGPQQAVTAIMTNLEAFALLTDLAKGEHGETHRDSDAKGRDQQQEMDSFRANEAAARRNAEELKRPGDQLGGRKKKDKGSASGGG